MPVSQAIIAPWPHESRFLHHQKNQRNKAFFAARRAKVAAAHHPGILHPTGVGHADDGSLNNLPAHTEAQPEGGLRGTSVLEWTWKLTS